jgi:copper transporter 1
MTYNGWVMIAVAVGAAVGHMLWSAESTGPAKSMVCH